MELHIFLLYTKHLTYVSITSRDQSNEPIRTRVKRVTGVNRSKSVLALLLIG